MIKNKSEEFTKNDVVHIRNKSGIVDFSFQEYFSKFGLYDTMTGNLLNNSIFIKQNAISNIFESINEWLIIIESRWFKSPHSDKIMNGLFYRHNNPSDIFDVLRDIMRYVEVNKLGTMDEYVIRIRRLFSNKRDGIVDKTHNKFIASLGLSDINRMMEILSEIYRHIKVDQIIFPNISISSSYHIDSNIYLDDTVDSKYTMMTTKIPYVIVPTSVTNKPMILKDHTYNNNNNIINMSTYIVDNEFLYGDGTIKNKIHTPSYENEKENPLFKLPE